MKIAETIRTCLGLGLALALCSFSGAAFGQAAAEWDQERVTSYAEELQEAAQALYVELGRRPNITVVTAQRAYHQARDDLRILSNSAKHLVAELKQGAGREETWPTFRRIQSLRRSAEENGRKAMIEDSVMAKITPVGGALIKLAPYYAEEARAGE